MNITFFNEPPARCQARRARSYTKPLRWLAIALLCPRSSWWCLTLQWIISAYALTFGGFLLLGGRAADRIISVKV